MKKNDLIRSLVNDRIYYMTRLDEECRRNARLMVYTVIVGVVFWWVGYFCGRASI